MGEPNLEEKAPVEDEDEKGEQAPIVDEQAGDEEQQTEEEWMKEGDEPDQTGAGTVPLHALVSAKRKLKGRISERDDEIQALRAEIDKLKIDKVADKVEIPKRPRRSAFDDDDAYDEALDQYEQERETIRLNQIHQTQNLRTSQERAQARVEQSVSGHYERAEKLLQESGITADAFRAADQAVREAVENIRPKMGDAIMDQFIARLGEGSEKVMFRLGRSKALMGEFIGHLSSDPTGLDAATFLGQQKAMLINSKRKTTSAPPPDTQLMGDKSASGQKERALKQRYQEAHKKGDAQKAWNAKKEARSQGVDISGW